MNPDEAPTSTLAAVAVAVEVAMDDPDFSAAADESMNVSAQINEDGSITLTAGESVLDVPADMISPEAVDAEAAEPEEV